MQPSSVFRRPGAKEKRAKLAAKLQAYEESFSYEDDLKKAAQGATAASASGASADRRDKRR